MERTETIKMRATPDEKRRVQELADREAAGDISRLIRDRLFGAAEERIVLPEDDRTLATLEQ